MDSQPGTSGINLDEQQEEAELLHNRDTRYVYLITYSQADLEKFPRRLDFANAVQLSFSVASSASVQQWCCSLEEHERGGYHYHMAIKLEKKQRWMPVKRFLGNHFHISVHFSSVHHNYYSAWKYVTKSDEVYEESPDHPDLTSEPRTNSASKAKISKRRALLREQSLEESDVEDVEGTNEATNKPPKKKKRLTPLLVSDIILAKNITSQTELLALAQEQREEGKTDLAEFILNKQPTAIPHLIQKSWEMYNAKAKLDRATKSRIQILQDAQRSPCVTACRGQWLECANEIFVNNCIASNTFSEAVKELLKKGRGKYRNIMLIGAANCGKTFLLNPLNKIYDTFTNPASGTFAWVGAEDAECIFLNDFRWSEKIIPWHDLLLMLEGQEVHLPAPKTHFARDATFIRDTPIFATSKYPLVYIKSGSIDNRESEMMSCRWRIFAFNFQIPEQRQRIVPSCPRCFADLILQPSK